MKLLVISTVEFDLNGITSVILNYNSHMNKDDLYTDFVVINEPNLELRSKLENEGSGLFVIPRKKNPVYYMITLFKVMQSGGYDIVHVHGNSATMILETGIAQLAGIPVRIAHSHNTTCTHPGMHKVLFPLFRHTYTHGFACGQEAGEWLFRGAPFEIIRNGIDLYQFGFDEIVRDQYRKMLNVDEHILIGHVGNFVEQKNHMFLLVVFSKLVQHFPQYRLVLMGTGHLEDFIKQEVRRLAIEKQVIFVGRTSEVHNYLKAIDMFVLPSLYEGLPVSLIEAQGAGLPCLVSDTVSEHAKLTELVEYLTIDDAEVWCDRIVKTRINTLERKKNIERYHMQIVTAGYDINYNAERLRKLYVEYQQI